MNSAVTRSSRLAARLSQGVYAELRTAYGSYRRLVKERTGIVNLIKSLLDGLFPEFTQVFKNPCGQTAASVLCTCAVPQAIAGMTESEFVGAIEGSMPRAHYDRKTPPH